MSAVGPVENTQDIVDILQDVLRFLPDEAASVEEKLDRIAEVLELGDKKTVARLSTERWLVRENLLAVLRFFGVDADA